MYVHVVKYKNTFCMYIYTRTCSSTLVKMLCLYCCELKKSLQPLPPCMVPASGWINQTSVALLTHWLTYMYLTGVTVTLVEQSLRLGEGAGREVDECWLQLHFTHVLHREREGEKERERERERGGRGRGGRGKGRGRDGYWLWQQVTCNLQLCDIDIQVHVHVHVHVRIYMYIRTYVLLQLRLCFYWPLLRQLSPLATLLLLPVSSPEDHPPAHTHTHTQSHSHIVTHNHSCNI